MSGHKHSAYTGPRTAPDGPRHKGVAGCLTALALAIVGVAAAAAWVAHETEKIIGDILYG